VIRVDCGAATFLPYCTRCAWRGLPRADRVSAARSAADHAVTMHADKRARADLGPVRRRELAATL
jgi:hypothetical protein